MTDDEANELGLACALERYMSDWYDANGVEYERFTNLPMAQHLASELKRYGWLK